MQPTPLPPRPERPRRARKAVIPAAGLGTRFMPATKAVPKELLPVVDVPALEYIVAEAAREGLADVLVVTGRGKEAIENHFDSAPEVEQALEKKGDTDRLARVRRSNDLARMHFVRQQEPNGLGDAVSYAEAFVGNESFAVLLGDDIIDERDVLLKRMLDVQAETGGVVVGLIEVEGRFISLYGSIKPAGDLVDDVIAIETLIEKPKPEEALSNLAVIGRYVLPPTIFDALRRTELGQAGRAGADRRHADVGRGRRADSRRCLPRPALRHGRSAGLSTGRRPAGVRASRAGSGLLGLAGRVRRELPRPPS